MSETRSTRQHQPQDPSSKTNLGHPLGSSDWFGGGHGLDGKVGGAGDGLVGEEVEDVNFEGVVAWRE